MTFTSPLRQLCLDGGEQTVALRGERRFSRDDLRRHALHMAASLRQRSELTWALWLTRPYDFLCAFMALALAGKRIVLPANMQPQTALLLAEHFDALISCDAIAALDRPSVTPAQLFSELGESAETQLASGELNVQQEIQLQLFTSGSTGAPQAISKTLTLLEAELQILQQQWGALLGNLPLLATVSHQHIYGLLHAVLWPLLRGAPFIDEVCQYPEELMANARAQAPVVLVSSPTHLKRLPHAAGFRAHANAIAHSISSGGLLDSDTALTLADILGEAPLEAFGSTETGGVAWRQQNRCSHWRPLPGVSCQLDAGSGCLAVTSAHLGQHPPELCTAAGAFVMGDLVSFHADGSFTLRGRADQIAKVEGKRLSVTEMERHLQAHPLIQAARVAVIRSRREEVGAAVVLNRAGEAQLAALGKLPMNQMLREYLLAFFERPLLPRRWRYLTQLPVNSQGKILLGDVQALLLQKEAL